MHLENFDQVADAIATRDLIIKDLTLRLNVLEEARERHIDLLNEQTKLYDALQARIAALESRPQYVPYPVPQYTPFPQPGTPWPGPWSTGPTCSGNSASDAVQQTTGFVAPAFAKNPRSLGFPY